MSESIKIKSKKGTWTQALISLISPILFILVVRWLIIEPFQIPSGSMIPTLLIHDHIFVQKYAYGMHGPWGDNHWFFWRQPKRGDVVVFRYPQNPEVYYIKRLMGLPGDEITWVGRDIYINGKLLPTELYEGLNTLGLSSGDWNPYDYFKEKTENETHIIQHLKVSVNEMPSQSFKVPEHSYFMMGDNRDESSDSRYWGYVDQKYIVGKAGVIWLSCSETLESSPQLCNPAKIRVERIFKGVE